MRRALSRPGGAFLIPLFALSQPAWAAFVDNGDGTVSDTVTGLMWDQCALGQTGATCSATESRYPWQAALAAVPTANAMHGGAGHKGYHDWRLPNINELESLANLGTYAPAIDGTRFPNTLQEPYWSSTIYPALDAINTVDFRIGNVTRSALNAGLPVRLVRGGQPFAATGALPDITAPLITGQTVKRDISDVTHNSLMLTSNEDVWGWWLVVPRDATAPTAAQIKGEAAYGGTVAVQGDGQMNAGIAREFPLAGLVAVTPYDIYAVVRDGGNNDSAVGKVQFATVPMYTLAAVAAPSQGGSARCAPSPIDQGGDATCVYTADPAYTFTGWSGDCTGTGPCAFTAVAGNKSVTAKFSLNYYPIAATANPAAGGAAACDSNPVGHGLSTACAYTANPGYRFTGWSGDCAGSVCALANVVSARSVTANFALIPYAVAASSNPPAGGDTPPCAPGIVHYGEGSTCTTTASPGYVFVGWSGACAGQPETCHLTGIRSDTSSAANFAPLFSAGPINDTGQGLCYDGTALTACSTANTGDAAIHPRQDARFGRDARAVAGTLSKTGGGAAGFDFTALDTAGQPAAPGGHACVRDNATGLVWSGETFAATWADAVTASAGYSRCGLARSWRLPSRRELLSIVNNGTSQPAIDGDYFPGTAAGAYWSGDAYGLDAARSWQVDFADGAPGTDAKGASHAVRLVSNGVNHAPSFTLPAAANQTVLEDAGPQTVPGWAQGVTSGDVATQALRFIVSNDNPALFSAQPAVDANGTLTYTPAPDANGSANVTVRLADDGGIANGGSDTSAPRGFVINVLPVNDPPRITLGPDINLDDQAAMAPYMVPEASAYPHWRPQTMTLPGWATGITAGAANESGQHLTATLTLLSVTGQKALEFDVPPTLDPATGTLSFTVRHSIVESITQTFAGDINHLLDWYSSAGLARVQVELKDDGGTANGGADTTIVGPFTIFLDPMPKAVDVSVRSPWRSPCVPVTLTGWDADSDFNLPPNFNYNTDPYPWPVARINTLPQNGFLSPFVSSMASARATPAQGGSPGHPAATARVNGNDLELVPASAAAHKALGVNFYGSLCYVPFQSTWTGFDSFTFTVKDPDGNESAPATVTIEIFEN